MLLLTLLLQLVVLIQILQCGSAKSFSNETTIDNAGRRSSPLERESRRDYLEKCGAYFNVAKRKKLKFSTSNYYDSDDYFTNLHCAWTFLGSRDCTPEIVCMDFDLRREVNDRLTVKDGLGGKLNVTGDDTTLLRPYRASGGGRDLFVKFWADKDTRFNKKYRGFQCAVSCSSRSSKAKPLPSRGIVKKEEYRCLCGLQPDTEGQRIVGGEDTKFNEFPWQVALVNPGTREAFCGGSIINNQYILTATHCFWFSQKKAHEVEVLIHAHVLDFTIVAENASKDIPLGEAGSMLTPGHNLSSRSDMDEKSERYKVTKIIMHPLFTELYDYDAALLRLDRKISFVGEDAPTPVCLPNIANLKTTYEGEKPTVSGWGLAHESAGASTRLLQKLSVPVIPYSKCDRVMPGQITERMICAGYIDGVQDACTGDSGGPLSIKSKGQNKQTTQIGIVSWGEGCARENRPGIYSRVTEFLQWIYHHANTAKVTWCRSSRESTTDDGPTKRRSYSRSYGSKNKRGRGHSHRGRHGQRRGHSKHQ